MPTPTASAYAERLRKIAQFSKYIERQVRELEGLADNFRKQKPNISTENVAAMMESKLDIIRRNLDALIKVALTKTYLMRE